MNWLRACQTVPPTEKGARILQEGSPFKRPGRRLWGRRCGALAWSQMPFPYRARCGLLRHGKCSRGRALYMAWTCDQSLLVDDLIHSAEECLDRVPWKTHGLKLVSCFSDLHNKQNRGSSAPCVGHGNWLLCVLPSGHARRRAWRCSVCLHMGKRDTP